MYFEKYDKLKPPAGEGDRGIVQQRENSKIIAFYFVRLFQILGAMLMVVKDISYPELDSEGRTVDLGMPKEGARAYVNQPGAVLARFKPPSQRGGYAQHGGSAPKTLALGPYDFLRYYMNPISGETISAYKAKYGIDLSNPNLFQITTNLFIEYTTPSQLPSIVSATGPGSQQRLKLLITPSPGQRPILRDQDIAVVNLISFSELKGYISPSEKGGVEQFNRYPTLLSFNLKVSADSSRSSDFNNITVSKTDTVDSKDNFDNGAAYKFETGTGIARTILGEFSDLDPTKNFKEILEKIVFRSIQRKDPAVSLYKIKDADSDRKSDDSTAGIGKPIGKMSNPAIDEIYKYIQKPGPERQPHCIARALQLIDTSTIKKYAPTSGVTSVCKFVIGDTKTSTDAYSHVPLKSVSQLFGKVDPVKFKESLNVIEAFVGSSAKMTSLSVDELKPTQKDESEDLAAALERLAKAFEFVHTNPVKSFKEIELKKPAECTTDEALTVKNQQVVLQMQSVAQQLLAYHINHTIEISKFLKVIFNIKQNPDGTWKVEGPKTEILYAGFAVLDQLTDQARDLLIDYYSGCEELYQKGLKSWKDSAKALAPAASAAPAAAQPTAPPLAQPTAPPLAQPAPQAAAQPAAPPLAQPTQMRGGRRLYSSL
jgi:hypothetical protein